MQLDLFQGAHLPLVRARVALEAGDIRGACGALSGASDRESAQLSARLALLEQQLLGRPGSGPHPSPESNADSNSGSNPNSPSAEEVHAAFAAASERELTPAPRPGPIPPSEWFRFYAGLVAEALAAAPDRRFRGWCGLDWELAAGRTRAALARAEALGDAVEPWTRLEAARAAQAAGDDRRARAWILAACLRSRAPLDPLPPALVASGCRALDGPDAALPRLPAPIEALWIDAEDLGLPEPASAWIPALGVLEGVFPIAELCAPDVVAAAAFDAGGPAPAREPAAHGFLRALVAARAARVRERPGGSGCGAAELEARGRMRRAAGALLERYLEQLGLGFP